MDPMTLALIARSAMSILVEQDEAAYRRRLENGLRSLMESVDSLVVAPWDEGVNLLRQAATAEGGRRERLVDEARAKFSDATARRRTPDRLKASASYLTALCWSALAEPELAGAELLVAESLASSWLREEQRVAFRTSYGSETDPMWQRLDDAASLVAAIEDLRRLLAAGDSSTPLAALQPHPGGEGTPPPTRDTCQFIGRRGPRKLGSVWHRLRELLEEDTEVQWFTDATDLRLLATRGHLVAYSPNELKHGKGLRFRLPLTSVSIAQEGREWFDAFVVLQREDQPAEHYRVNLGPADHAQVVMPLLRRTLESCRNAA